MAFSRILNFFRRNPKAQAGPGPAPSDRPANSLEFLLTEAAGDASKRARFFRALPDAELYVPGTTRGMGVAEDDGSVRSTGELQVQLSVFRRDEDGAPFVPAYTSLERFKSAFEGAQGPQSYLKIRYSSLLEVAPEEAAIHLNAGAGLGVFLSPEDAARIAKREVGPRERSINAGDRIAFGRLPAEYEPLARILRDYLGAKKPLVRQGYLAVLVDGEVTAADARPVLGIDAPEVSEQQFRDWVDEISALLQHEPGLAGGLDIMPVSAGSKIAQAFEEFGTRLLT